MSLEFYHVSYPVTTEVRECQDSDYESDLGPAGLEPDTFCADIEYESDTEVFHTTSACTGKQNYFNSTREVIEDVAGFDHEYSNLCTNP